MEHIFWSILSFLTMGWYIVVTGIVAYRGGVDIKKMLEKLGKEEKNLK